jgi:ferritin-like metal-binding protein YciE
MPEVHSLHDVFVHELRDMYNAEQQITKALPKLIKAAESGDLRDAFETHLDETHTQIDRLEQAFELLNEKARGVPCDGMTGILAEGRTVVDHGMPGPIRDAALIGAAQRVEHYETAVYGTLIAWAKAMALNQIADLLKSNLDEEKNADEKLSQLAQSGINDAAVHVNGATKPLRRTLSGRRDSSSLSTHRSRARKGGRRP